jgi:Flp pilus assembly protein TadD
MSVLRPVYRRRRVADEVGNKSKRENCSRTATLGRYDEAVTMLTRAAQIFEDRPSQREAALRGLGDTYTYQGRLAKAIDTFSAALAVFREAADTRSVAGVLNGVADAYRSLSRWDDARCPFETCCFAGIPGLGVRGPSAPKSQYTLTAKFSLHEELAR